MSSSFKQTSFPYYFSLIQWFQIATSVVLTLVYILETPGKLKVSWEKELFGTISASGVESDTVSRNIIFIRLLRFNCIPSNDATIRLFLFSWRASLFSWVRVLMFCAYQEEEGVLLTSQTIWSGTSMTVLHKHRVAHSQEQPLVSQQDADTFILPTFTSFSP